MNKRDLWILVLSVNPCFVLIQPILSGPLNFFLLLKPMSLAFETLRSIDPTENGWLGYKVPEWFNECLDDSAKIQEMEVVVRMI